MDRADAQRTFPADTARVRDVLEFVTGASASAGLNLQRAAEFLVALEEAFINVCNHGYAAPGGTVVLRVKASPAAVVVEIEDQGTPFDPLSAPEPSHHQDLDERPLGGLGIQLIRRMTDEVRYRRQGGRNVLTLVARTAAGSDL